ncbi:hypothetical protein VPNG_08217 [Cytospora leucostoma]|uniref:Cyanovirin-N domain-containing protein n=1 Tax=Cytospora leucostoma TaxID=1230097 RepID=A0A423W7B4_9PEZI|nr:hypothetical protein VPNG_08217 [Cytospora leucostoma]
MRHFIVLVTIVAFLSSSVIAGGFTHSCYNYYFNNGVSDGSGDLHIEAFCSGGLMAVHQVDGSTKTTDRPPLFTKLRLQDCYKNVNGVLEAYDPEEEPSPDIMATCAIESCAIISVAAEGPILTCYCQNDDDIWAPTSIRS